MLLTLAWLYETCFSLSLSLFLPFPIFVCANLMKFIYKQRKSF